MKLDDLVRYNIRTDGWYIDGNIPNVSELRPKAVDSENIIINLGCVDLGHIDLMVQDGFYSIERTSFAPPFAISSIGMPTPSGSRSRERP